MMVWSLTYSQTSWNVKSSGLKGASLPTKLVEVMEFQLSYLKSSKICYESVPHNMPANLENSAVATGLEKVSFHSNPKEEQCQRRFRLPYNWLILHDSKVILKILQARLQQYGNFQMYKMDFKKAEEPEIKLPTPIGS